ncbi:FtsX-like permease family protein [Pedobacter sp. HMF7647]|uniref:FtsX-like permease family protein n=1 Tax=Hufsiella arboris TaxID=2695275 RepID=A0A7K1YA63_9SPHI|nr:ABC transporter permease [Hufsiella arboris]MXV51477.1 FtsX-like permease family protein [Hufsiella arboris]
MLKNYLTIALRNLGRNKIYAFINIAGLGIGLACSMLIMLYVKDEVSYDRFHDNVKNIYRVVRQERDKSGKKTGNDPNTGYFQGPKFAANVPGIKSFVRIQSGSRDVKRADEITSSELLYVDSSFFSIFSFPLEYGNKLNCLKDPYSVVLSEEEAKKQFGTANAVGKIMQIKEDDGFKPYTVTAVVKKTPENSSIQFNMLLPLKVAAEQEQNPENWFNIFLNTFVVLQPNANLTAVQKGMQRFYEQDSKNAVKILTEKYGPMNNKTIYQLQSYADMHLSTDFPAQNGLTNASKPLYSYILSGIVLFILLIACINFVNLTIARALRRTKEIGIRKVIGSERKQLIFQFLGETFLLSLLAFLLAILLVQLVTPVFNNLSNKALSLSYLLDVKLISGYVLLFLLTGFLAGIYPALILSGYKPVDTLYNRFIPGGKNYIQRLLVVVQFALASFLIIATFTLYSQFNFLTHEKLGYDDNNLVMVNKQSLSKDEAKLFKTELMKNPSITGFSPKNGGQWGTVAKTSSDSTMQFSYETVDESYVPLLKIKLQQGRNFSKFYPSDADNSVLVNEAFVKKARWKNPLEQKLNFWYDNNKKYTVIGVVKDYHFQSLGQEISPQLFTMKDNGFGVAFIKIKAGKETASLDFIQKTFKRLFPLNPYSYTFKNEENLKNYEAEAKWKQIMLYSAVLTIFISCIGLFGLSVLTAEKRIKEIGIRKVLGASVNHVVTILSVDFIRLVAISLVIAVPLAWLAANKWLQNYPYRINLGWEIFVSAGLLVILIALFTVSFQAVKAAIANPVKSLRTE